MDNIKEALWYLTVNVSMCFSIQIRLAALMFVSLRISGYNSFVQMCDVPPIMRPVPHMD